ncbi:hypothetical protein DMN91_010378 [Ooceraea biroi]|uniref:Odorant receptor n=1 Tax=Ooceraea biroi TaxID=2015173 RepID=A0A026VX60_OOCBI|nr:uncharacterized protein LOC105285762 [Ooceraea biroi]EZA48230.1 hypothetical protein X777_14126 [Ooceraea biroi]RLU18135.1 hypothetical protein DMN91_010378 [Ooceraea biroi]
MVFAGERCFKLHRIMLIAMGLWPYQKPFIWRMQAVFFFSVYCFSLFSQFTPFFTRPCNMECILKRFSYICNTFVYIMNYYSFYFNSDAVKQMFEHMQLDWKIFKNNDAMNIFEEYLFESYIFAVSTNILVLIGGFGFIIIECRSIILDIIIPMLTHKSRPRQLEMDLELFVDKEHYFFLYLGQELLVIGIGTWSMLTTGTFLTTVTKHSCATYKIVSYLIQNTVTVHTLQLPVVQRIQYMRRNICLSVYLHRRTLEFCKGLLLSFDMWYFPLLLVAVLSLSCILFRLYNAIIQFDELYGILVSCITLGCYFVYMFMGNFLGQTYTEHSVEVLDSTYDTLWYVAPLPIQKLFLIMQKSIRSHKIILCGLFVASIEGFSALVTSAVSYFTVMHAMRS